MASRLRILKDTFSNVVNPQIKPVSSGNLGYGDERVVSVLHSGAASADNYAVDTAWFYSPIFGQPRSGVSPIVLRQFSQTVWVAAAIKTIIDEVCSLPYEIPVKEKYKDDYDEDRWNNVKTFFDYPNRNGESIRDIFKKVLRDVLAMDCGVIVKVFSTDSYENVKSVPIRVGKAYLKKNKDETDKQKSVKFKTFKPKGDPHVHLNEIYVRDGSSFLINPDLYGILPEEIPAYFQYSYLHPKGAPIGFHKREIVYFKMNPRTQSWYGWSPVESLITVLENLNDATRFNRDFFRESAIPSGALSLLGANSASLQRFKSEWDKNIKGKPHKLVMFNEEVKWQPFTINNRDMEWLNGQKFYQRLVWAMYGVTADELGFTESSNRSVGQAQSRVFVRRAVMPHIQLLERKFTNDIITEFYEGEPECELRFDYVDQHEGLLHREEEWKDVQMGIKTPNEIRQDRGLEPLEGGDELRGASQSFGEEEEEGEKNEASNKPILGYEYESEEEKEKGKMLTFEQFKKKISQTLIKKPTKFKSYADALLDYYKNVQALVMDAFDEEVAKKALTKDYSSFLRTITPFFVLNKKVRKQIAEFCKKQFNIGITEAETELNIDIGFRQQAIPKIDIFANQQISGYRLPSGKMWHGIQGVNAKMRERIAEILVDGVKNSERSKVIAAKLKEEVFAKTNYDTYRLAKTESARISGAGKLQAYMDAGVKGKKHWLAYSPTACAVCKSLDGKAVEITDKFKTVVGGKNYEFDGNPAHPNCNCNVGVILK